MNVEVVEVMAMVRAADARLQAEVSGLSSDEAHTATDLPGWSRTHVVAHMSGLARALRRQAEFALAGKLIEMYDGGRPSRDAAIEQGACRPWSALVADLNSGIAELEREWSSVDGELWNLPVTYRNATLSATVECWWREVEIHSVDLKLGYRAEDWPASLSEHLIGFFAPRLPADRGFILLADETGRRWEFGTGEALEISGPRHELAAWLAQRSAGAGLRTVPASALPELSAQWP